MSALSGSQHVLYYGGRVNSVAGNTLVNSLRNFRIIPPYGGCSNKVWYYLYRYHDTNSTTDKA
jgi:hypothetical protein